MAWPQANDFQEAVQDPRAAFADADLKEAEVRVNALGLPEAASGTFGIVYQMTSAKSRWAVKCFTSPSPTRQKRYATISKRLVEAKLPFTVAFDYQEQGIQINQQWFPILKMDWVEGQTLIEFVSERLDQPKLMGTLSETWLKVAERLQEAKVTHADLQHGNVILVPDKAGNRVSLKLVDYDGMYLSSLAGLPSGEMGHKDYQHPRRLKSEYYGPEVDRFSHLVIFTAIKAVQEKGRPLWDRYPGESLLFRQEDFANPAQSAILDELWKDNSKELRTLVGRLVLAASGPVRNVPHLDSILKGAAAAPLTTQQAEEVDRIFKGKATPNKGRARTPAKKPRDLDPEQDDEKPRVRPAPAKEWWAKNRKPVLLWSGLGAACCLAVIVTILAIGGHRRGPAETNVASNEEKTPSNLKQKVTPTPVDNLATTPVTPMLPKAKNDSIDKLANTTFGNWTIRRAGYLICVTSQKTGLTIFVSPDSNGSIAYRNSAGTSFTVFGGAATAIPDRNLNEVQIRNALRQPPPKGQTPPGIYEVANWKITVTGDQLELVNSAYPRAPLLITPTSDSFTYGGHVFSDGAPSDVKPKPPDSPEVIAELKQFQGAWVSVRTPVRFEFDGANFTFSVVPLGSGPIPMPKASIPNGRMPEKIKGTVALILDSNPKGIDFTITEGPPIKGIKGIVMAGPSRGIYRINGDRLEINFPPPGPTRPTSFTGPWSLDLTREKK